MSPFKHRKLTSHEIPSILEVPKLPYDRVQDKPWYGSLFAENQINPFICFVRIPACDRQTDRQMDTGL